ncbi:hypothetical protein E8E14_009900 [Neopestalotiopsis sp. 37M]|nr:hypothetical protein E8E14_009900 [Neopestalotiopsis sp. 37M]
MDASSEEAFHSQPHHGTRSEKDHNNRTAHWKPWGTRSPVIIAFIVASLVLAAVIEVLAQKGLAAGVLSPSPSINDIPDSARLAALYIPTVIAVLYGFYFSCIDLDVKRIQPWIELAKPGVLLDYDFDFLPFVPLRAARRRHWPVFYSGLIIVIIFWVITPLQSAIFGTGTAELTQAALLTASGGLIPVEEQAGLIDVSVLNGAFATIWLNQTYPQSLTAEVATLPIQALEIPQGASSANWTGWTWQLSTELKCWPAIQRNGTSALLTAPDDTAMVLDNGQGCTVPKAFAVQLSGVPYVIRYIGWFDNARLDFHLASKTCDERFKHQFLALSANLSGTYNDITSEVTAQFCEPSYYKQNITVPISGTTLKPDFTAITEAGQKTELTDAEFNRTAFEYLLGTGVASIDRLRDYPDEQVLEGYYQVRARDPEIPWPIEVMPTFAIGSGNWTGKDLLDTANQASAFAKAHQAAFSIAVDTLLDTSSNATQQGNINFRISGILISRTFSAVVEILLVIAALLAGVILLYNWRAQTNLPRNTSSIARIMQVSQQNEELLRKFGSFEQSREKELKKGFEQVRFETQRVNTEVHLSCISASPEAPIPDTRNSLAMRSQMKGVRPTVLKVRVAILVMMLLVAGVSILAYLKYREVVLGGLPRPTENFEVLQILENYIPTGFATFMDPYWVLINRIFCLVQPFRTLQKGNATAKRSIECDYTGLMPQFNMIKAVRSNHYFLVLVCIVALLGNILAVGLGGIFDERQVDKEYNVQYQPQRSLVPTKDRVEIPETQTIMTDAVKYNDNLQLVLTNLSAHTSLPPWTTPEAYFLPFADISNSSTTTDLQRMNTTGIVYEPRCSTVGTDDTSSDDYIHFAYNNTHSQLYLNHVFQNGSSIRCGVSSGTFLQTDISAVNITGNKDRPRGSSSNEIYSMMQTLSEDGASTTDGDEFCSGTALVGWVRANATTSGVLLDEPESKFIMCTPTMSYAPYQVTVDSNGYVLDSQRVGDLVDIQPIFGNRTWSLFFYFFYDTVWGENNWHNTTVANDWMNSLLEYSLNDTTHIDPNQPLMDTNILLPAVESVMREGIAALFGINPAFWKATGPDEALVGGIIIRSETRIFMSEAAFIVSESILVIYIIVAILVYIRGLGVALPRLPTTIGSVVAYVAGSRAVRLYNKDHTNAAEKRKHDKRAYRYGTYVGRDGKMHVGIELESYSQPSTIRQRVMPPPPSRDEFAPLV